MLLLVPRRLLAVVGRVAGELLRGLGLVTLSWPILIMHNGRHLVLGVQRTQV